MWQFSFWTVIDSLVSSTTPSNIEETVTLIDGICRRVPCMKCREHYKKYKPLKAETKKDIQVWVINFKRSTKEKTKEIAKKTITSDQFSRRKKSIVVKKGGCRRCKKEI